MFSTLSSFASNDQLSHVIASHHEVKAAANTDNACSQFLCEESENETEHDHHEEVILLPFSITFFDLEGPQFTRKSAQPLTEQLSNPIYLSVCSFRI